MVMCPKCKTTRIDRSHRRGPLERCAAIFGCYPYRCRNCNRRFLRFNNSPAESSPSAHPGVEREIRATRGAIRAKRKRRELLLYSIALVLFLSFLYFVTRERDGFTEGKSVAAGVQQPQPV